MSQATAVPVRRTDETDRQLLERFVAQRDEAAFALLVQRHGPRVLRICRRVLHDEHAAEDMFQATFLVLAQKAAEVAWHESIGGWLGAAAYRLARHAHGAAQRRREQLAAQLPEACHPHKDPEAELARRELRRVVADELQRLPEKYRVPVVLCYLEGKTNEEAARQLGWPTGSMSRRLARARTLLREYLTRRGLAILLVLAAAALATRMGWDSFHASRPTTVAEVMRPFQPATAGGQGLESVLERLAAGEADDRGEQAVPLARQAVQMAEWLH